MPAIKWSCVHRLVESLHQRLVLLVGHEKLQQIQLHSWVGVVIRLCHSGTSSLAAAACYNELQQLRCVKCRSFACGIPPY
jgi:hypothetical protein